MSKFMKVLVALVAAVAIAAPAFAAGTFSLGGELRFEGVYQDATDGDYTDMFVTQRLRIAASFKPTDRVTVYWRTDFSDGNWGDNAMGRLFQDQGNAADTDRAYADIALDAMTISIGTFQWGIGGPLFHGTAANNTGLKVALKDVPVTFAAFLRDNNENTTTTTTYAIDNGGVAVADGDNVTATSSSVSSNDEDTVLLMAAVNLGPVELSVGHQSGDDEYAVTSAFAWGHFDLDVVKLMAGVAYFTGQTSDTIDAKGLEVAAEATMAISETVEVGAGLYYGADTDDDEEQITAIGQAFGDGDYLSRGPLQDEDLLFGGRVYDIFNAVNLVTPFAIPVPQTNGSGVMAGQIFAKAAVAAKTDVTGSIAYAVPADDEFAIADSAIVANAGISHMLVDNVQVALQGQYVAWDQTDIGEGLGLEDQWISAECLLEIKF